MSRFWFFFWQGHISTADCWKQIAKADVIRKRV